MESKNLMLCGAPTSQECHSLTIPLLASPKPVQVLRITDLQITGKGKLYLSPIRETIVFYRLMTLLMLPSYGPTLPC